MTGPTQFLCDYWSLIIETELYCFSDFNCSYEMIYIFLYWLLHNLTITFLYWYELNDYTYIIFYYHAMIVIIGYDNLWSCLLTSRFLQVFRKGLGSIRVRQIMIQVLFYFLYFSLFFCNQEYRKIEWQIDWSSGYYKLNFEEWIWNILMYMIYSYFHWTYLY